MIRRGVRKNVLLIALGFFLIFVFVGIYFSLTETPTGAYLFEEDIDKPYIPEDDPEPVKDRDRDGGGGESVAISICGNGALEAGEDCDDGNLVNLDGCSSDCLIEKELECCDDDDNDAYEGGARYFTFLTTCTNLGSSGAERRCDEFTSLGSELESCNNDASRNPGVAEVCGNSIDENCDGIIEDCPPVCGDGEKDSTEVCDDGNNNNGDGCSASCTVEPGYTCTGLGCTYEFCDIFDDSGSESSKYICTNNAFNALNKCQSTSCVGTASVTGCQSGSRTWSVDCYDVCGNGIKGATEACDDGNTDDNDGCSSSCTIEPEFECCDDDDNDGWLGAARASFWNICGVGYEKLCKDITILGEEDNSCDGDASSNPGIVEICNNNKDDNCNGEVDEGCPYCGDGVVDIGEGCDINDFGGETCADSPQYTGGPLSCFASCTIDYTECDIFVEPRNYWANMDGDEIVSADLGDRVQMIAEGVSSGTFNIKEADPWPNPDDDIRDVDGLAKGDNWVGVWTITQEDLDKTSGFDLDEFYFEVGGKQSEYLEIFTEENDDPTTIIIEGDVECGDDFDEGESAAINITARDSDDVIVGTITVDGEIVKEFSNGGVNFVQLFDTPGDVQVVVETDTLDSDNGKKRVISNVMVLKKSGTTYVDGVYVAACITEPEDFSDIPMGTVDFDVSNTRGIRVTGGVPVDLVPGKDEFSWYWTFHPGEVERNFEKSTERFAYIFTAEFPVPGVNTAELRVEVD